MGNGESEAGGRFCERTSVSGQSVLNWGTASPK